MLEKALVAQPKTRLDRIYEALRKIKGLVKGGGSDTANRIKGMLYRENGVWKGRQE
jgi:hypothetical protein